MQCIVEYKDSLVWNQHHNNHTVRRKWKLWLWLGKPIWAFSQEATILGTKSSWSQQRERVGGRKGRVRERGREMEGGREEGGREREGGREGET